MKFLKENWFKVGVLILISVGIYLNYNKKEEIITQPVDKSSDVKTVSTESQFKKKQECGKYMLSLKETIKEKDYYISKTGYQNSASLEEVFYSPRENSCLYLVKELGFVNRKLTFTSFTLADALTGNIITSHLIEMNSLNAVLEQTTFLTTGLDYYR